MGVGVGDGFGVIPGVGVGDGVVPGVGDITGLSFTGPSVSGEDDPLW